MQVPSSVSASSFSGDGSGLTSVFEGTSASSSISTRITSNEIDITSLNSVTGSYATTGSNSFVGDQKITGSLIISGSATSGLTIEGPIQVNHSGSPSAVFTANSDTNEQVLIYDSKIAIEDSNQELAILSANEYGTRFGILKLAEWTSGIVGASLTAGAYRNFLKGQLVVGRSHTAGNTVHGHTLDVTGSAVITGSLLVSGSGVSGSFSGSFEGDGSGLTGIETDPFPYTGDVQITGSLTVSGSVVDFMSASAVLLDIESLPLVNPIVEYVTTAAITSSGTTVPLPNSLTFVSSSTYEYLEVFINGLRMRYDMDFIPASTASVQYQITIPSGSEVTYKSLKRP